MRRAYGKARLGNLAIVPVSIPGLYIVDLSVPADIFDRVHTPPPRRRVSSMHQFPPPPPALFVPFKVVGIPPDTPPIQTLAPQRAAESVLLIVPDGFRALANISNRPPVISKDFLLDFQLQPVSAIFRAVGVVISRAP